ncbi:MAG: GGDEF domain-containing protein [Paenibacillaceae bacterium]|nr:GGDEF domain-containing protein [Paenibacillaceae bacterium]
MSGTWIVVGEQSREWAAVRALLEREADVYTAMDWDEAADSVGLDAGGLVLVASASPDGWLARLREEPRLAGTPAVVLALRRPRAEDAQRWRDEGASDVLDASLPQSDIVQRLRAAAKRAEEMRQLAYTDPLTGAWNRRYLDEWLSGPRGAAGLKLPLALAMLDLDRFKAINDTYGHDAGDRVLRRLAELFRRHVRRGDRVVRYGGEEFVLLFPQTTATEAQAALRSLAEHAAREEFPGVAQPVTFSAGIAEWRPGQPLRDALRHADQALYRAKDEGRGRVLVGEPEAGDGLRVLLVGADVPLAALAAFGPQPLRTASAAGVAEAAAALAAEPYDLCAVDMDGPEADPFEWIRRLRAAAADRLAKPRLVALSAKEGAALRYLQLGADEFVWKGDARSE